MISPEFSCDFKVKKKSVFLKVAIFPSGTLQSIHQYETIKYARDKIP